MRRIHLIAPAGPCRDFFSKIGVTSAGELIASVQDIIGPDYHVSGNEAIIDAAEDAHHGGRNDDGPRAADITEALADSNVCAIIMLRGGAWFTRILPRIDFSALDHRTSRIALFAFSELTPLVNIIGAYPRGLGIYGMGPVFLGYGLKRFAAQRSAGGRFEDQVPREWMRSNLHAHFREYFLHTVAMIEGRAEPIAISAELVRGRLPDAFEAAFTGGNLTVLSTMIGSHHAHSIDPAGKWIVLEDYNDKPERFDRYLAHLTLAGFWDRCAGVLLGDFHQEDRDLTPAMLEILDRHMACACLAPVLVTRHVGHTWPMTPLPLHLPAQVTRQGEREFMLRWASHDLRCL